MNARRPTLTLVHTDDDTLDHYRWSRRLSHHGNLLIADALVFSDWRQTWTA